MLCYNGFIFRKQVFTMAKEKQIRPDKSKTADLIKQVKRMDTGLQQIAGSYDIFLAGAQENAKALYSHRLQSTLEEMDVEQLNKGKQGIRVSLLREAGVENMYQVSQLRYSQICAMDGLGEQSARKIVDTAKQITENTKKTLRVRLQVNDPHQTDDDLVRSLYLLIHGQNLSQQAKALVKEHHAPVQQELNLAKKSMNGFGWLFASQSKKAQLCAAVENLENRLCGSFGSHTLLQDYQQLTKVSAAQCWVDFRQDASRYYAQLEQLGLSWVQTKENPGGLPEELTAAVEAQELDLKHLKATLRSYQTFGTKYIVHQQNTLLGDEMGLGKTIQAIASMAALKAAGKTHFMVVCPASVLINWCREIRKHSDLEVTKVHGNDEQALLHWRENGDVAVTTYESISRFQLPERFPVSMVVVDEAHYAKNPQAQRTKALLSLLKKTQYTLFMSGTPLENRVEEMCFLIGCLQPQVARQLESVKYLSTAEQFRLQLAPVYLRRTREDVLTELPDLTEKEQWCVLNRAEQKAYREAVLSDNFMAVRQVSWQTENLTDSSKAARLLELCDQAKEQNRKVIVFSYFRATLEKVTRLLGDRCLEIISGSISPQRRQEIVDEFTAAEDGTVLVSQVQAGGTGLNIQSASVVIFCEPQLKPSIENQAIARAYRMGQVRDVLVYRLLADDTIDERIMELLKTKQNLFDNFADESVVGTESLKPSEQAMLKEMVEQEKQRLLEQEAK